MRKSIVAILLILAILSPMIIVYAVTCSDPEFVYASTNLKNTKTAVFSAITYEDKSSITVIRVELYKKDENNAWEYLRDLPLPTDPSTTPRTYSASRNYSGYIGTGTYRIKTTFRADAHSLSGYSNTITY